MTMFGGRISGPGLNRDVGQLLGGDLFYELLRMQGEGLEVGLDRELNEISGRMTGERLIALLQKNVEYDPEGDVTAILRKIRSDRSYGISAWEL